MVHDRIKESRLRPDSTFATRRPLLALILFGLILGFAFQGSRGLWSPDEGRYTVAALQMLDSGNYLAPAYSPDEVNFSKPPTTYWIIAASFKVFGRNTWAARIPYGVAFLLTLLVLYAIGKRLMPEKAWLPGLVYGCATAPFVAGNIISTDAFLTLCEGLAMLGFLRAAFDKDERDRRRFVLLMWLGWGLAFLTKGPPGLIPLLAVIPFIVSRNGWHGLGRYFPWQGLLLFLLIGGAWYFVVIARYPGLLHYFLYQEVYNRLFTAVQHRNAGFFGWIKIYVPTLALGTLPWWPSVGRTLRTCASADQWKAWKNDHAVELFLVLWFLVPFVVFCLAQSRLPLYLLPLFLPLSLLLAFDLRHRIDLSKPGQRLALAAWIVALLALKGGLAYGWHAAADNRQAARELSAMTQPATYQAVIFVEDTALDYTIEEATPWGLRLYMGKPVYGIPWFAAKGEDALCHALRTAGSSLVVIDPDVKAETLGSALNRCSAKRVVKLGTWRHSTLEQVQI